MSIEQVQKAGELADKLWQDTYGEKTPDPAALDKGKATPGEPKPDDKPPEAKPDDKPVDKPKEGITSDEPKPEDFEHKFKVLKGKYDAEVPSLSFQLAEANRRLADQDRKILDLESKSTAKPKEEIKEIPKEEDPKLKTLRTEYPDIYEGAQLLADQIVSEKLSKLDDRFKKVDESVSKVNETIGESQKTTFLSSLDGDVNIGKEWREINVDPAFVEWLQETDRYTGKKKHDLLMEAWNRMDQKATLAFFNDFKALKPPVNQDQPKKEKDKEIPDESLSMPRGSKSETKTKETGDLVTPQDLQKFYQDVTKGLWKGREAEMKKEEDRLLKGILKPKQ